MNCKPGDLAVIVKPRLTDENIGRPVTVVLPLGSMRRGHEFVGPDGKDKIAADDGFYWWVHGRTVGINGIETNASHITDARLRPLRDPGEDARDETLEWLPVPSHTKETA